MRIEEQAGTIADLRATIEVRNLQSLADFKVLGLPRRAPSLTCAQPNEVCTSIVLNPERKSI